MVNNCNERRTLHEPQATTYPGLGVTRRIAVLVDRKLAKWQINTKTGWNNGSTTLDGVLSQPCDDTPFKRAIQARVVAKARQHGRLELTVKELVVKRGAASHYLQLHNRTGGIPPVLNVKPEVVRTTAGHQLLSSTFSKAPITLSGICDWKKSRSLRCSRSSVRSPGIAATP